MRFCLSPGFWNMKAGSHSEKKGCADQQKRQEDVPRMFARSEGRLWSRCLIRSVSAPCFHPSLRCRCSGGKKNTTIFKINCWYHSRASPSSSCAYVWPPVHLLMWKWWAKPISSLHIFSQLLYFAYNLIVLHWIHIILDIYEIFTAYMVHFSSILTI